MLETAALSLFLDGEVHEASGIRLVAVHPDWRGQGLSRDLMTATLTAHDASASSIVLLYAEVPALYLRYGFRPMPQHAFLGPAPRPVGKLNFRDLEATADIGLIERLLTHREPVSSCCALVNAAGLFLDRLEADPDIRIAHLSESDSLLAYEIEDETLVVIDVVSKNIPPLASILGAIGGRFEMVKTLFPPDRLAWRATPTPDDTGLMIRGTIPPAMRVPFMLPPTAEF